MPTLPQKAAANKPADRDWAAALQAEMLTVVRQAEEWALIQRGPMSEEDFVRYDWRVLVVRVLTGRRRWI
jgi:hypothetical protein